MSVRQVVIALGMSAAVVDPGIAAGSFTLQDANSELNAEALQCVAYYGIVARCTDNSGRPDLSANAIKTAGVAMDIATSAGAAAGVSANAVHARLSLEIDQLLGQIDRSCMNMAVLILNDAKPCKALVEQPNDRLAGILQAGPAASSPQ